MKKRLISLILIITMAVLQIPLIGNAQELKLDMKFNKTLTADDLTKWQLPEVYTVDHTGIHNKKVDSEIIYIGEKFDEKYEFSFDFRLGFSDSNKILFNYTDNKNYQSIELVPHNNQIIVRNVIDANVYSAAIEEIDIKFKATQWYNLRIVSNGGEGVSAYLNDGKKDYTLIENAYVENAIGSGFVGYNSGNNPLELKNFRVITLGKKDYVKPVEPPKETTDNKAPILTEKEDAPLYDETAVKVVTGLGIIPTEYANSLNNYITRTDLSKIFRNLGMVIPEGDENVKLSAVKEYILMFMGYNDQYAEVQRTEAINVSLAMMRNLPIVQDEYITVGDLMQLFYNVLEQKVLFRDFSTNGVRIYTVEGKTFLTEKMGIHIAKGQITDNGISSLTGAAEFGGRIAVDGTPFMFPGSQFQKYNLLGRYVKIYYSWGDWKIPDTTVLAYEYLRDEDIIEIPAEDFIDYADHVITYQAGERTKTQKIENPSKIVYNGTHKGTYDKDLFQIENGTIRLVRRDNGYDTVIITEYEDMLVGAVDRDKEKVYGIVNYNYIDNLYTDYQRLELDLSDSDNTEICLADGKELTVQDLKKYDALTIIRDETGKHTLVTVSRDMEKFFDIESISNNGSGKKTIKNSQKEIVMSNYCVNSGMLSSFKPGQTVNIYLNAFGEGVWAEYAKNQDMKIGCMAKVVYDYVMDSCIVLVFQTDGERKGYYAADKVTLLDENGDTRRISGKKLYDELEGRNEIITFMLNDDDQITRVELAAATFSKTAQSMLKLLADSDEGLSYDIGNLKMGKDIFFADDATIFTVPESEKTDIYSYTTVDNLYNLQNATQYPCKLYGEDSDMISTYAILYDESNESIMPKNNTKPAVVTDVVNTVDSENEPCIKITCNDGTTKELTMLLENADNVYTWADFKEGATKVSRDLKKGDIIKYSVDYMTGYVNNIVVIYNANEKLLGVTGVDNQTNPYMFDIDFDNNKVNFNANAESTTDLENYSKIKITHGYITRKQGKVLEFTTTDLSAFDNPLEFLKPTSPRNDYKRRVKINYDLFISVNIHNDKYVTVPSSLLDEEAILSFEEVGKDCTEILYVESKHGNVTFFINK